MAGKAERDEKSSRKEEGRDSSYRPRIDLWTLAASRGKVRFPRLLSFSVRGAAPRFFLPAPCLFAREHGLFSHGFSLDAAQMRPQLPLFRRSLSELAAPSKSYHTLSGISINAAALIARSSPYYRRAALRSRSYAALAEFIATPSSAIRRSTESA